MTPAPQAPLDSGLPPGYTLQPGVPPIPAYLHLRQSAGLTPVTESQAARVASGSWYSCHITFHDPGSDAAPQAVAMGRVVGDGGWYFTISDMATLPEHQRKGLGGAILRRLLEHIRANSAEDGQSYVSLFADPPGRRLYLKNGFVPAENFDELGMVRVLKK